MGDRALLAYTKKYDGIDMKAGDIRVPETEIKTAYRDADPKFIDIIDAAATNIRKFHETQKQTSYFIEDGDGVILGKRILPIERVALLIPGASAPLFSTLLMAAIPAQIAGVPHLCIATPPQANGAIHPSVLATAHHLRIREIYKVFGAQAIAALAYGTETIPRVDKLVGPGNPYVQIAKKRVFGTVDIDMIAGPSEIVVIADHTANAKHIAADLLSQAEHGSGYEAAVCITPSADLATQIADEIAHQAADLTHREAIQNALNRFGAIVVVRDLAEGIDLANRIAPEHLELIVAAPLGHIYNRFAMPALYSSARHHPNPWATTTRAPTTSCPQPAPPDSRHLLALTPSPKPSASYNTPNNACKKPRATSSAWPKPRASTPMPMPSGSGWANDLTPCRDDPSHFTLHTSHFNLHLNNIKPEVRALHGYHLTAYDCPIKLNQNESPFDVPDSLKDDILCAVRNKSWSRYPEPMQMDLVEALADHAGVQPEGLIVCNGSNTLVQLVLGVVSTPGVQVVIPSPSFSLYGLYTDIFSGRVLDVPLTQNYCFDIPKLCDAASQKNVRLIILCSPQQPHGMRHLKRGPRQTPIQHQRPRHG